MEIGEIFQLTCKCQRDEIDAMRESDKAAASNKARIERLRERGIADELIRSMRFETDKGYNAAVIEKAKKYVAHFDEMLSENVGIIFTGSVGTGKTFYAACIANALIEKGILVVFTSFTRIIRTSFDEYPAALKAIEQADLVVFDDVGAERDSSFAYERAFEAVDTRIKTRKPIIATTNLSPDDFTSTADVRLKRIYDRLLGACVVILVSGESVRALEQRAKTELAKNLLA
jgi:DNA replication protein DnaC